MDVSPIRIFQKGFNYSQDGPGNRLVYHFQGCNLHCPWCANPESMSIGGTLMVENSLLLESLCPHRAIYQKQLNRTICDTCSTRECLSGQASNEGISLSCKEYTVDQIVDEVLRSAPLFYDGGASPLPAENQRCNSTL